MRLTLTNLRTIRLERRVSQRTLAHQVGRAQNWVWMLEAGVAAKTDDAAKLAQALGVTVDLLAGRPLVTLPAANGNAEGPGA